MDRELLVVVGPTGSGKTELALRLAERLGGEVIGADSVQIYRHFEVGSGKPRAGDLERAPHHLISAVEPLDPMDAARWATLAEAAVGAIQGRGKRVIVCGGTFLWVKALLHGLAAAPPADPALRERHRELAEREGRAALHARLARVDERAAARLGPNDLVRVSRALEVFELTGRPQSAWHAEHGFRQARFPYRLLGVAHDRETLRRSIEERVGRMLDAGWVDEVRALLAAGFAEARAMGAVGYKELAQELGSGGRCERAPLAEVIARATRIYARRQRTWLRDQPVEWLSPDEAHRIV